jgi:hypothetical protein
MPGKFFFNPQTITKKKEIKKKLVGNVIKENMLIEPKLRIVITKAGKSAASLSRVQGHEDDTHSQTVNRA